MRMPDVESEAIDEVTDKRTEGAMLRTLHDLKRMVENARSGPSKQAVRRQRKRAKVRAKGRKAKR